MSGKQHHHKQNPHLHRPVGATRTIPLAPPAKEKSSSSSNKSKKLLQSLAISWLSPRVNPTGRPNRKQRSHYNDGERNDEYYAEDTDDNNGRGVHLRQRRSSFDETQADARGGGGGKPQSNLPATTSNATNKLSAGDLFRQHIRQHQQQHRRQQSGSLLTTFLLYFDALLPEYFIHFVNASDIENNGASNAVSVLERGARTVQRHAIMSQSQPSSSSTQQYKRANTTAAASSTTTSTFPSSAPTSPSHFHETSPSFGGNNEQQQEEQQQPQQYSWLTMSPRTREKLQRVAGAVSPRHINSMKFNATLQAEWERFTSPFHLLAGAEVLYGEMLHVLDPEMERRFVNGESILSSDDYYQLFVGKNKDDRKSSSSSFIVKFDNQKDQKYDEEVPNQYSSEPSPPTEQPSSHKRGSRRLIAMYRQVRDDLIIVGEYLCDPVLGSSHANIDSAPSIISNNISNVTSSEFTPQSTFDFTPQSSPQKKYREYGRSQSQPSTPEKNNDAVQFSADSSPSRRNTALNHDDETEIGRQIAAKSLRNTLDALIAFVDARCVLVKIHADLCCWHAAAAAPSPDGASGNKWTTLAEQCRLTMAKLSFWTARGTMVQAALLKLEIELKALQLALQSIYHMMECDFFNCVLSVRKLHVLLGQKSTPRTSLQVKWIKASLRRTLSMMKIIFDNKSNDSPLLSRSPSLHKNKPLKSLEESGQVDLLLSEFIGANDNGLPLAVIVVHRATQKDHDENVESSIGATKTADSVSVSWTPLYMKSTLDRSRVDTSAQTRNNPLVQMIIGISGSNEGKVNSTAGLQQEVDNERERSWPFVDWPQIEKNLTMHSGMNSRTYSVTSSPTRSNPSTKLSSNPSNATTSQYHIVRITNTISIVAVAQGAHHTIEESLIKLGLHLMPENIFNVSSILQTKASIAATKKNANERGGDKSKKQQVLENSALWSDSGWSDVQRKKVLHSLGLRSKHSPVVSAPLKSPYVRRQISRMRQRKKKARNPLNSGHLAMFLGHELSHLI